jgi:hypothetical protein
MHLHDPRWAIFSTSFLHDPRWAIFSTSFLAEQLVLISQSIRFDYDFPLSFWEPDAWGIVDDILDILTVLENR